VGYHLDEPYAYNEVVAQYLREARQRLRATRTNA